MEAIESIEYKGYTIKIIPDEIARDPREQFDHLGTMICDRNKYKLGDNDVKSFDMDRLKKDIYNDKDIISLPLYLYDHSGITINTTGFSCPWDSGQVGWIIVDKKKVKDEFHWKRITGKREEQIMEYLRNEVKEYDNFLNGAVYGYEVFKGDNEIDSCWGFFGIDNEKSGLLEMAKNAIDCDKDHTEKNEGIQQELELA